MTDCGGGGIDERTDSSQDKQGLETDLAVTYVGNPAVVLVHVGILIGIYSTVSILTCPRLHCDAGDGNGI